MGSWTVSHDEELCANQDYHNSSNFEDFWVAR